MQNGRLRQAPVQDNARRARHQPERSSGALTAAELDVAKPELSDGIKVSFDFLNVWYAVEIFHVSFFIFHLPV